MTTLNMNDEVEVTLTDYGREVLDSFYRRFGLEPSDSEMGRNPIRMPLWDLMSKFGPIIHMGMRRMPFERNEVRVLHPAPPDPACDPSEGEVEK